MNWLPGNWPVHYFKFGKLPSQFNPLALESGLWYWSIILSAGTILIVRWTVSLQFQALNDPRFSLFSHGNDQTASLTISGGVPTLQYSVSGSAAGNVGNLKLDKYDQQLYEQFYGPVPSYMVRPDNYQTYGGNGQLTAQPNSKVRVTLQSSLFNSNQQQGSLQGAITQLEGVYINAAQ